MDGAVTSGWYDHPQFGLIKIFLKDGRWVFVCYAQNGEKALSRPRDVDPWLWALSQKNETMVDSDDI